MNINLTENTLSIHRIRVFFVLALNQSMKMSKNIKRPHLSRTLVPLNITHSNRVLRSASSSQLISFHFDAATLIRRCSERIPILPQPRPSSSGSIQTWRGSRVLQFCFAFFNPSLSTFIFATHLSLSPTARSSHSFPNLLP